jgi:hypothetical protein
MRVVPIASRVGALPGLVANRSRPPHPWSRRGSGLGRPRAVACEEGSRARRGFRRGGEARRLPSPRPAHCLAGRPPARFRAAPTRRTLPVSRSSPSRRGPGHHPGRSRDLPRLAGGLRPAGHVARGPSSPRPSRMSGSHPGIVAPKGPGRPLEFSPGRTQKLPGTRLDGLFAVRHRLRSGLTGKRFVFAPFMVELFPAAVSNRAVPGPRNRPGPSGRPDRGSPRQPRCARDRQRSPRGRDSHPL